MKKFKSFIEDENLKDFEEDLIGEAPPNTADAKYTFVSIFKTIITINNRRWFNINSN